MKPNIKELFHFTRSERRGVVVCISLVLFLFLFPKVYAIFQKKEVKNYTEFEEEIKAWETGLERKKAEKQAAYNSKYSKFRKKKERSFSSKKEKTSPSKVEISPQYFSPNTASKAELLALGLPEKTVTTLMNFRNKGGRFYKKEDLKKIYGFKLDWYEQLAPFIQIEKKKHKEKATYPKPKKNPETSSNTSVAKKETTPNFPKKKKHLPVTVDINKASEEDFKKIYGIGTVFSKRMVAFREKLGGYARIDQIAEIYGLPDSTFQKIKPQLKLEKSVVLKKININTATVNELKKHPYLKWRMAKTIVKYRTEHGHYKSIEDVAKCKAIDAKTLEKIKPYFSYD